MEISKIEASLNYGRFFTGKRITLLYICLAVSLLLPVITILILITILAGGMDWSNDMVFALVGGNIFSLFLLSVILWVKTKNKKLKQKIIIWLDDAVELKAYVKRLDIVSPEYKPYQIQINFEIGSQKYHRISAPGNAISGYHKIFAKYDNKKINILYSPKYDEVLILKNN